MWKYLLSVLFCLGFGAQAHAATFLPQGLSNYVEFDFQPNGTPPFNSVSLNFDFDPATLLPNNQIELIVYDGIYDQLWWTGVTFPNAPFTLQVVGGLFMAPSLDTLPLRVAIAATSSDLSLLNLTADFGSGDANAQLGVAGTVVPYLPTPPVPEPSTWAMMLIGLAVIFAARSVRSAKPGLLLRI